MFRFFLAFLILGTMSVPVSAKPICGKRGEVIGKLSGSFSEKPSAMGLTTNGDVIEVLTSPSGATWTIVVTMPNGTSCLIALGENWESGLGEILVKAGML